MSKASLIPYLALLLGGCLSEEAPADDPASDAARPVDASEQRLDVGGQPLDAGSGTEDAAAAADLQPSADLSTGDSGSSDGGPPLADAGPALDGEIEPADAGAMADGGPGEDVGGADAASADLGTGDAGPPPEDSGALPDGRAPGEDAALPPEGLCADCDDDDGCLAVGEGAECTRLIDGTFCTIGCDGEGACPAGYRCVFGRCTPAGARCGGCATSRCAAEQRCNLNTGECEDLATRCASCRSDDDCGEGLGCTRLGLARFCLPACDPDGCPEGFVCNDERCRPASGICDACGGCAGALPVCDLASRQCVQCGGGTPCAEPLICSEEGACVEPAPGQDCRSDLDCRQELHPLCHEQRCVACRDEAECAAGHACVQGECVVVPCAGVSCQQGAACDPATQRCLRPDGEPGCRAAEDCAGDGLRCNEETGQCYQRDQRCDPDGLLSVCAPGGLCGPDPFDDQRTVCSCLFEDPTDLFEPNEEHLVPCQPDGICVQLGPGAGACVARP